MKTIIADQITRWLERLNEAQAHLTTAKIAMGIPGYTEAIMAGYAIDDVRRMIVSAAVQDVTVEVIEPVVRVGNIIPGSPVMERDVALVMAAE